MTVVLVNERGEFRLAPDAWGRLLMLGTNYGWKPRGTVRGDGWSGCYGPPCGQMIRARDAAELALALEDLLDDLPDHEAAERETSRNALERFGGTAKPGVTRLVEFLRGGAVNVFGACGCRAKTNDVA